MSTLRIPVLRATTVTLGRAACVVVVAAAAEYAVHQVGSARLDRWVWLGASVVLAVVVIVGRTPLDRLADRVAYGPSGDPHSRLSGFVERISETLAIDDVLPRVAQTVTQATHSERSDVRLWLGDGAEVREVWPPVSGQATGSMVDVPLRHHGAQVGVLGVTTERDALTAHGRELLDRLAGPAGLALANVRLTYDLRHRLAESRELAGHLERSRGRLLAAEAEQTERFARLTDERVVTRLDTVEPALDRARAGDPDALAEASRTVGAALEELRDIAAGVFPPTLSENGLRVAFESLALRHPRRVEVRHQGTDRRSTAELEAAAYFCGVQLVEDATAADGRVRIGLEQAPDELRLVVSTDRAPSAVTLQLVADRVEATGGALEPVPEVDGDLGSATAVRWPAPDPGREDGPS